MAIQPPAGTPAVFLSMGSTRLNLAGSLFGSIICVHPTLWHLIDQNPSTSGQRFQDTASNKRTRSELPDIPLGMESEPLNLSSSIHPHNNVGVGISMAGSGGVSLTLGLHQNNNNGISLSDRFPINTAQRFGLGLEVSGEGYDIGGFEAQNRHFGRDVMGGQLLHDFVG